MVPTLNEDNVFKLDAVAARARLDTLTPRETQIVELLVTGDYELPAVAETLGISRRTLDVHMIAIRRKLKVKTHGIARIWYCAKVVT